MGQFNIFFFILDELFEKIQFETLSNLFVSYYAEGILEKRAKWHFVILY